MKKPEVIKDYGKNKEGHEEKDFKHFCPVCDKPTAIFNIVLLDDGETDITSVDLLDYPNTISPDADGIFSITWTTNDDTYYIDFTPKELEIKLPDMNKTLKQFYKNTEREWKIADYGGIYFCSEKCFKKFILERLKCH